MIPNVGPHISHHISLELFTPHYSPTVTGTGDETGALDDLVSMYYTHPCRCSGEFVITHQDLEDGVDVVGCGGCGEWVRVGYEVVASDEAEDEGNKAGE